MYLCFFIRMCFFYVTMLNIYFTYLNVIVIVNWYSSCVTYGKILSLDVTSSLNTSLNHMLFRTRLCDCKSRGNVGELWLAHIPYRFTRLSHKQQYHNISHRLHHDSPQVILCIVVKYTCGGHGRLGERRAYSHTYECEWVNNKNEAAFTSNRKAIKMNIFIFVACAEILVSTYSWFLWLLLELLLFLLLVITTTNICCL